VTRYRWDPAESVNAVAFDTPIAGWQGNHVNTLRLWSARATDPLRLDEFNRGDHVGALADRVRLEAISRVLYPSDETAAGHELRLRQEFFFASASLQDLLRRHKHQHGDFASLSDHVAIQLNDTHPAIAVVELMRLLIDDHAIPWELAWSITTTVFNYTNHTLLPEALEKWPLEWFEDMLPRHLEIIFEINRRLLDVVRNRFAGDAERMARVSLVEEGTWRKIRMANLAIVGSHSTNGVAAIHSKLLRTMTVKDLAELYPERFNNKTNGVTPRRWLLLANPALSDAITEAIGDGWITALSELSKLKRLAGDKAFRDAFLKAKREAKSLFTRWLKATSGQHVDPDNIFDCQVKRSTNTSGNF